MRVIKPSRIHGFGQSFPDAKSSLNAWLKVTRKANWQGLMDVRATYPKADGVKVASGRTVTVFNIGGNKYRLIVAIHYNTAKVYVLRFMTHAGYDGEHWKRQL
ncbi:MAG: type II toxin-antitoxin system HigB family toxin [Tepidisphaeraceae bacterium]|jgi:mRNA interferase HigB